MDKDFGFGKSLSNHCVIGEVIEMAVGEPEPNQVPSAFGRFIEQRPRGMIGSIEQDRLSGPFIGDEKTIGHRNAAAIHHYAHGRSVARLVDTDRINSRQQ